MRTKLYIPLKPMDEKVFLNAVINGSVFLEGAGDRAFFRSAGLSFGAGVELARLAKETINRKSKYSHRCHIDC